MRLVPRHRWPRALALLAAAALVPAAADAQSEEDRRVELHGFGGWGYGRTSANRYGIGEPSGDYSHASFDVNIGVHPAERLHVVGQLELAQARGEQEVELDYAFAEWRVVDALKLRMGKVKHPFGLYAEIYDVGTLRPFFLLPQGLYGPTGLVAESYMGAGLTGAVPLGEWGLAYDAYGGAITFTEDAEAIEAVRGEVRHEHEEGGHVETARDVLGARVTLHTPVPGLSVAISGYSGIHTMSMSEGHGDEVPTDEPMHAAVARRRTMSGRHSVVGGAAEYLAGRWSLRTEYVLQRMEGMARTRAGYVEAAVRVGGGVQAAVRYDAARTRLDGYAEADGSPLLRHEDVGAGVNYWLSPHLVVRSSYHLVAGNRLAHAASSAEIARGAAAGELPSRTRLWLLGAHFSF